MRRNSWPAASSASTPPFAGAYVFSSGKNMGVFKAVGYPEDVGDFYRLEEYEGYCWTAHGRYPTNTPGWWGGAHPFAMLEYSVVHNGEISSYDANRRFIEMFGYKCTLLTDTEVITYMVDYLLRRQGLTLEGDGVGHRGPLLVHHRRACRLRKRRGSPICGMCMPVCWSPGPFPSCWASTAGMMALNDRLKLRSMVVAEKGERVYIASEECAIRAIEPAPERVWAPRGGEPVIVRLNRPETARTVRNGRCAVMPLNTIYPEFEVVRNPEPLHRLPRLRTAMRQRGARLRRRDGDRWSATKPNASTATGACPCAPPGR